MFIIDALLQILDFFLAQIFAGQLPQENSQANVYNFFNAILQFLGLIGA